MLRIIYLVLVVPLCFSAIKRTKFACENSKLKLFCSKGEFLSIQQTVYGREVGSICGPETSDGCRSESGTDFIKTKCDKKQKCFIEATNDRFQDPCPGVHKYLEVKYVCDKDPDCPYTCDNGDCATSEDDCGQLKTLNVIGCENKQLNLQCDPGTVLSIKDAKYGRRSRQICPHKNIRSTNCISSQTTLIKTQCDGSEECVVDVKNAQFGDPCPLTYKYLEVDYDCVPAESSE